jgi:diguanylate cyclase (GGDEF)-like protein/PAS domain S-box-containing protein
MQGAEVFTPSQIIPKALSPYVTALVLVFIALLLRWALHPYLGSYAPYMLFTLPIVISALYLGFKPALFTSVLGTIFGTLFFAMATLDFSELLGEGTLQAIMFFGLGIAITLLGRQLELSQKAFNESEQTAKALLESATQAVVGIGKDGRIKLVNKTVEPMLGYQPESLMGKKLEILIPESDRQRHTGHRSKFFQNGESRPTGIGLELTARKKDGTIFPIEVSLSITDTPSGPLAVSFISDISKRKAVENALALERAQLRSILTYSPLLVSIQDLDDRFILINPTLAEVLRLKPEDVIGKRPQELAAASLADGAWKGNAEVLQTKSLLRTEGELVHPDGSKRTYLILQYPVLDINSAEPYGVCTCMLDITEQKEAEQRALHAAQHDPLTGLPNRALVYEFGTRLLHLAQRHGTRVCVLFFDLDRFKPINDTYGHEVGDKMLQEVANRLRSGLRSSDVIGRIGGDEFVALIDDIESDDDIRNAANHLLELLRKPYRIGSLELRMSPSIGISLYPDNHDDVGELIRLADAAMYQAKNNGRNTFQFYSPDLYTHPERAFALEQRLRHSMTENDFELFYQPIVDTHDGSLVSVEALLRWHQNQNDNEAKEIILPGEFIPAAETSGLINQLGQWAIRDACRQHETWRQQGLPAFRIAVNVSPLQFRSKHFKRDIARAIAESGIDPSCVELEVTETTVMQQVEQATRTLKSLKNLGVRIALDDFGTGYSSLSHLSNLPIDKLKVDQSFIKNIETDPRSLAIAETVIALGKKLNVEVVAEGIESEEAMQLLAERECDLGQGYFIGAPMRSDEFVEWYRELNSSRVLH